MLKEIVELEGCDEVCGEVEHLTELELSSDVFITGSVTAPAN